MFEVPLYYQNPWSLFLDIVVREMLRLEISTLHVCWLPSDGAAERNTCAGDFSCC